MVRAPDAGVVMGAAEAPDLTASDRPSVDSDVGGAFYQGTQAVWSAQFSASTINSRRNRSFPC